MKIIRRVADYFVRDAADHEQRIRHMKLQRRCYYAQGFHVALRLREPVSVITNSRSRCRPSVSHKQSMNLSPALCVTAKIIP